MDFTLKKYTELIQKLKNAGYLFVTFEQYCSEKESLSDNSFVVLRHDVDLKAENSLQCGLSPNTSFPKSTSHDK